MAPDAPAPCSPSARAGACPSDEALLSLAGGHLAPGERGEIEAHLARCSDCRAVLAAVAPLIDAHATTVASASPDPADPPDPGGAELAPPLSPGQVLAERYRVKGPLGAGGMGVVYEALHLTLGAPVALKLVRPERGTRPEVLARFLREARTAARLSGPHVCRVLDAGMLPDGRAFVAMERLEGEDLAALSRRRGPLPVDEAISLVAQACEGLEEAHALGVVHRDVKPANLFLARSAGGTGVVKVLDFGLAKALSSEALPAGSSLTSDSHLIGSPAYMAPEQIRAPRGVDARADVWSLGVVLHELLCGAPPFSAITAGELWSKILVDPPEPLRSRRPDAPAALEAIIARCLEKDPARRYPSARALAEALSSLSAEGEAPKAPPPAPSPARPARPSLLALAVPVALAVALVAFSLARLASSPQLPLPSLSSPAPSSPSPSSPSPSSPSAASPSPTPVGSPPEPSRPGPQAPLASSSGPSSPPAGVGPSSRSPAVLPQVSSAIRKPPPPPASTGPLLPRPAPTDSRD